MSGPSPYREGNAAQLEWSAKFGAANVSDLAAIGRRSQIGKATKVMEMTQRIIQPHANAFIALGFCAITNSCNFLPSAAERQAGQGVRLIRILHVTQIILFNDPSPPRMGDRGEEEQRTNTKVAQVAQIFGGVNTLSGYVRPESVSAEFSTERAVAAPSCNDRWLGRLR